MKKILGWALALLAGGGVGGGSAYAALTLLGPGQAAAAHAQAKPEPTHFVPVGKVLAPLVTADGRLAGYESFEVQLEVAEDKAEEVGSHLPLLLNAINMRTYRTPMAAGPDGLIPDLGLFRKVAMESAAEAFGAGTVRSVAVTAALPG